MSERKRRAVLFARMWEDAVAYGLMPVVQTHTHPEPQGCATRIRRATNQAIPSGAWTSIVWSAAAYEYGGNFWTSGDTMTLPASGLWLIVAEATFSGAGLVTSQQGMLRILVDGVTGIGDDEKTLSPGATIPLMVIAARYFAAGTAILVQAQHSGMSAVDIISQGDHSPDLIAIRVPGTF